MAKKIESLEHGYLPYHPMLHLSFLLSETCKKFTKLSYLPYLLRLKIKRKCYLKIENDIKRGDDLKYLDLKIEDNSKNISRIGG